MASNNYSPKHITHNIKGGELPVSQRLYTAIATMDANGLNPEEYTRGHICQAITDVDLTKDKELLTKLKASLYELVKRMPELQPFANQLQTRLNLVNKTDFYVPSEYLKPLDTKTEQVQSVEVQDSPNGMNIDSVIKYLKGLKEVSEERTPEKIRQRIERLKLDISLLSEEYDQCIKLTNEKNTLLQAIKNKQKITLTNTQGESK